jgi:signal transduction histidine kinase
VLDNAGRYTPAGGKITASLRREGPDAHVDVSDTGVGIPEAERPHVFERLYRGSAARSLRPAGTGLGLAIARWIVDAHAGSIEVSPAQPRGTVVSISLPASNR